MVQTCHMTYSSQVHYFINVTLKFLDGIVFRFTNSELIQPRKLCEKAAIVYNWFVCKHHLLFSSQRLDSQSRQNSLVWNKQFEQQPGWHNFNLAFLTLAIGILKFMAINRLSVKVITFKLRRRLKLNDKLCIEQLCVWNERRKKDIEMERER